MITKKEIIIWEENISGISFKCTYDINKAIFIVSGNKKNISLKEEFESTFSPYPSMDNYDLAISSSIAEKLAEKIKKLLDKDSNR